MNNDQSIDQTAILYQSGCVHSERSATSGHSDIAVEGVYVLVAIMMFLEAIAVEVAMLVVAMQVVSMATMGRQLCYRRRCFC